MSTAAVFDLDRTLIAGSSAQTFGSMLHDVGIELPAPPGQAAYFALYERFGEDPLSMRLGRHAARLFKGQPIAKVELAGRLAADVLASNILPKAQAECDRHAAAGTVLVLATTAPQELAAPLAARAGFDDVVCTQYNSPNGTYDGTNASPYLWAEAKAQAVASWAARSAVDLTASFAYSDSWYDLPMLELVGNPVAVNPDVRLRLAARAKGWERRSW